MGNPRSYEATWTKSANLTLSFSKIITHVINIKEKISCIIVGLFTVISVNGWWVTNNLGIWCKGAFGTFLTSTCLKSMGGKWDGGMKGINDV